MSNESNTVASLLTDLDESRSDIIDAVSEMGGTVSENARFSELPAAVRTIQGVGTAVRSINTAAPGASAPIGTAVTLWSIDENNEMLVLNQVAQEIS